MLPTATTDWEGEKARIRTQRLNWDVIVRKEWKKWKKFARDAKGHEGVKATEEPFNKGIKRI